jgi:hypothetical protein
MQYVRGDKLKSALHLTRLNGYGVKYIQNSFAGILVGVVQSLLHYFSSSGIRRVQLYYPHPQPSSDAKKVCDPHKHAHLRCF